MPRVRFWAGIGGVFVRNAYSFVLRQTFLSGLAFRMACKDGLSGGRMESGCLSCEACKS